ncbi:class I SAM-dependent methyltransferase [Actinomadura sp. DC4]|uniref:class I SAM-dependent methyltransferase n=1 Tax=Actinomadura sp. DC4 TaxID=3055069 RepID=UPI0025B1611F|nr:class I SAM-dependent methyltransferase [Actinomadura sp. DC4]MDN3358776.1 class I SAM-dependent methyltransferase [Actinomadura sp. DC4]
MSMAAASHCPPEWLDLREGADADARATALLPPLRAYLGDTERLVVHDLGCGTGSMARWLAPLLPNPQHWVMHDRDPVLLARATAGPGVTVTTDCGNLADADLTGACLVTASALLDLLTAKEIGGLAAACAGRPALLTLSVTGRVELTPADPFDSVVESAFNAHQRRVAAGRCLLGPDAPEVATAAFEGHGMAVRGHESPWRLGPDRAELIAEWLTGRVAAVREQWPDLAVRAEAYLDRRLAANAAGELHVVVHHRDLLALPGA